MAPTRAEKRKQRGKKKRKVYPQIPGSEEYKKVGPTRAWIAIARIGPADNGIKDARTSEKDRQHSREEQKSSKNIENSQLSLC